jgi:hypothetical protein
MADSGSLRTRRWQHHKAGDHHLCREGCGARRGLPRTEQVDLGPAENFDAQVTLRDLARQLWGACQAQPSNALLARELRNTLVLLLPAPAAGLDAEFAQLMRVLSSPVPASETRDWLAGDDGG